MHSTHRSGIARGPSATAILGNDHVVGRIHETDGGSAGAYAGGAERTGNDIAEEIGPAESAGIGDAAGPGEESR